MRHLHQNTLPAFFSQTLHRHSEQNAMGLFHGEVITYAQLNLRVLGVMALLEDLHVGPGDRVAILSTNMPNWGIVYYATTFMGAVVVPILPDFHSNEVERILSHSEAKVIFVSDNLQSRINQITLQSLQFVLRIEDFSVAQPDQTAVSFDITRRPAKEYSVREDDLAAIIYTSGTSGKSKGVMLSHHNICFTAEKSGVVQEINEKDRFLSVLPLSHTYENTIGLILPMLKGACIYYLGKAPTPSILLPALQVVRPTVMLTVPLIIEKIFRTRIQPALSGNFLLKMAIRVPFLRKKLNYIAGKKLKKTFGGELKFFGIGGAKLNKTVEKFLLEAEFPYAIGYGLTETSPLLAGFNPKNPRLQSTGPAIEGVELKIHDTDPNSGEGEIWARGPNVMKGYYKEPKLTDDILTPDGWIKTGDLGVFDKDGYLYIKGRLKNMIIRSSGENIYPEEIESVINNFRYVIDSLVIEKKGKLVALVHFNREGIETRYSNLKQEMLDFVEQKIEELRLELHHYVNNRVNKYSQIQMVIIQSEPFEKTATQKIKRFLYR